MIALVSRFIYINTPAVQKHVPWHQTRFYYTKYSISSCNSAIKLELMVVEKMKPAQYWPTFFILKVRRGVLFTLFTRNAFDWNLSRRTLRALNEGW
jgi:hypothetical protein